MEACLERKRALYERFVLKEIGADAFVYMDPPYQLTTGSYNDGKRGFKGWNGALEAELFAFADRLSERGIPFMLSYVAEHKGKKKYRAAPMD